MPHDEMDTQMGVLEDLKENMDERLVGRIGKKKTSEGSDPTQNKARPDWVPGDGSQDGIEFSESGSDVVGQESAKGVEGDDYDDDEKMIMESSEYESLMG